MVMCSCCACIVWYKTAVLFMIVLICGLTPLVIFESECLLYVVQCMIVLKILGSPIVMIYESECFILD